MRNEYVSGRSPQEGCIFKKYGQVRSASLAQLIAGYPPGNINLLEVLKTALDNYFARKAVGKTKANGDDNLQALGAKFDIVHTALLEAIEPDALTASLMKVLQD